MLRLRVLTIVSLVSCLGLSACSDSQSSGRSDPDAGTSSGDGNGSQNGPSDEASIAGTVRDAQRESVLAMASLSTPSGAQAGSDAQGRFELRVGESDLDLTVARTAFATTYKPLPPPGGSMEVFLKSVDQGLQFRGDEGVTVSLPSGVKLEIPKDAVVDAQGEKVAGLVSLEFAAVDGEKPTEAAALPGNGTAEREDKAQGRLSIQTGFSIRIFDADKQELTVDKEAAVVAEAKASKDADAQIGVYSYDTQARRWKEESRRARASASTCPMASQSLCPHTSCSTRRSARRR